METDNTILVIVQSLTKLQGHRNTREQDSFANFPGTYTFSTQIFSCAKKNS